MQLFFYEVQPNHQFHYLTGEFKMFNVTVAAKFSTHAKTKYAEL